MGSDTISLDSGLVLERLIKQRRKLGLSAPVAALCPRCKGSVIFKLEPDCCVSCAICEGMERLNQTLSFDWFAGKLGQVQRWTDIH